MIISKISSFLRNILNDNNFYKCKVLGFHEEERKIFVKYSCVYTLEENKAEISLFLNSFRYDISPEDLIKVKDIFDKYMTDLYKLNILHIDKTKNCIILKRLFDEKLYFIKFENIINETKLLTLLNPDQLKWTIQIYVSFSKNRVKETEYNDAPEKKVKLRVVDNEI